MKKFAFSFLSVILICGLLSGCGLLHDKYETASPSAAVEDDTVINIMGMTGPTSMGLVKMISDDKKDNPKYNFTVVGAADEITPKLINGDTDIAALPANLASVIFNKTDGKINLLAINTLGVLYIVEKGSTVSDIKSLKGKTVFATGKGAVPEYVLRYILSQNGLELDKDVKVEWKSEPTEVVAILSQNENAVALLPEPYVTVAKTKVAGLESKISLNDEWEKIGNGSKCITAVLVVRSQFATEHKSVVDRFLSEYESSVNYAKSDVDGTAALCEKYGVIKEAVAKGAIPRCNLTFITGNKAKTQLNKYLEVLYGFNPTAVGGKLPTDKFYYDAK